MRRKVCLLVAGFCLVSAPTVRASEPPVTVSPGEHSKPALIADACPTFSWGAVPGAVSYEIVVYPVDLPQLSAEAIDPVLRHRVRGAATSWTPPLGRCLESGQSYAWLVRVPDASGDGDWSEARLFDVAGAPTPEQVRGALRTLRDWLGAQRGNAGTLGAAPVDAFPAPATDPRLLGTGAPSTAKKKRIAAGPTRIAAPVADEAALFATESADVLFDKKFDIELGGAGEIFSDSILNLYSNDGIYIDLDDDNDSSGPAQLVIHSGSDDQVVFITEEGDLYCDGRVEATRLRLTSRFTAEPFACTVASRGAVIYVQSFVDQDNVCFCDGANWLSLVDGTSCVFIN